MLWKLDQVYGVLCIRVQSTSYPEDVSPNDLLRTGWKKQSRYSPLDIALSALKSITKGMQETVIFYIKPIQGHEQCRPTHTTSAIWPGVRLCWVSWLPAVSFFFFTFPAGKCLATSSNPDNPAPYAVLHSSFGTRGSPVRGFDGRGILALDCFHTASIIITE